MDNAVDTPKLQHRREYAREYYARRRLADVIITIGALNDPVLEQSRYIGTTKNKKVRTGKKSSPNQEVYFDSQRGRYVEDTV